MTFNWRAGVGLVVVVLVMAVASDADATTFGLGFVIPAIVVMELLTYVGVLGLGRHGTTPVNPSGTVNEPSEPARSYLLGEGPAHPRPRPRLS